MKTIKFVGIILTSFIAVIGIAITGFIVFQYTTGNSLFAVSSKSMVPVLNIGDLIIVNPIELSDVKEGDVLTFRSANNPKITFTHRVVEVDQKTAMISTKGDANQATDPGPTHFSFCVGKVSTAVPYLGYIYSFISFKYGPVLIVVLILLYASLELERYLKSKKR